MFKIRHTTTGLYSTGGLYPQWTEAGVRWAHAHPLKHHIIEAVKLTPDIYKEAEIVEIEELVKRVVPFAEIAQEQPGAFVFKDGLMVPYKVGPARKRRGKKGQRS